MQVRGISVYKPVKTRSERIASVAIVAAIHVAAITALVLGLHVKFEKYIPPDITAVVIPQKHTLPADPPKLPRVALTNPTVPKAPEPKFQIKDKDDARRITTATLGPDGPSSILSTRVAAITDTHSKPPYPPISRRLGHEGMVLLKLTISPLGIITAVDIENSSGYADLDRMAAEWVKTHWRYRPATVAGHPVTSTAEASVRFSLKDSD